MYRTLALAIAFLVMPATADNAPVIDCDSPAISQIDMDVCAATEMEKAQQDEGMVFAAIRDTLKGERAREAFFDEERTWTARRDAECQEILDDPEDYRLKTMYHRECLRDAAKARTGELTARLCRKHPHQGLCR